METRPREIRRQSNVMTTASKENYFRQVLGIYFGFSFPRLSDRNEF